MTHTIEEIEYYINLVNGLINQDYEIILTHYNYKWHLEVYKFNKLQFNLYSGTKNEIYYTILNAYDILKLKE